MAEIEELLTEVKNKLTVSKHYQLIIDNIRAILNQEEEEKEEEEENPIAIEAENREEPIPEPEPKKFKNIFSKNQN